MMNATVQEIMTREVFTCGEEDPLSTPAKLMWDHDFGCVPVVREDGQVVGLLTDRDICMAAYTTGRPLPELRVAEAMSTDLERCRPNDSIGAVEERMRHRQIRRVPVIDGGRLVGIVSLNDVAVAGGDESVASKRAVVTPQEVAATLAAICTHRTAGHAAAPPSA